MPHDPSRNAADHNSQSAAPHWLDVVLLTLLVLGIYASRISTPPLSGEETRWARGGMEMIETGDWIVPRQQGRVFPERPPLNSWAMAAAALARGQMDAVAVRLPSVFALGLTTLLIYGYAATFISRLGAVASAAAYSTAWQVMHIGGLGESEAVFTLFSSGSLLLWHWGYSRGWPAALVWPLGYSLAALAALTKGLQGPIYFVAVTGVFLLLRKDWRYLLRPANLGGAICFAAIVGAWQIPFYRATDATAVHDIWLALVGDRLTLADLAKHVATYPLETLACFAPWSLLLLELPRRRFREALGGARPLVFFLLTAIAVTYPSVWFVAGARGRYFMPLYPCLAILAGLAIERGALAAVSRDQRRGWDLFLLGIAATIVVVAVGIVGLSLLPIELFSEAAQPLPFAIFFAAAGAAAVIVVLRARHSASPGRAAAAVWALAAFLGLAINGVEKNAVDRSSNDMGPLVADVKAEIPAPDRIVSFGPIFHRFAYFYGRTIPELPWPTTVAEVPDDVTYFCFDRRPEDTPQRRTNGRGRVNEYTPGTLPFAWEEIARIPCGRTLRDDPGFCVIVGRVKREAATARANRSDDKQRATTR
jgi:4-amino-4-deoxy-L-arabinose transferase-like glycosyltransferase